MNGSFIGEESLDGLLNASFLELNAGEADIPAARFILAQEYDAKIDPRKERELLKRLGVERGGGRGWMYLLGAGLLVAALTAVWLSKNKDAGSFSHSPVPSQKEWAVQPTANHSPVAVSRMDSTREPVKIKFTVPLNPSAFSELPVRSIRQALYESPVEAVKPLFSDEDFKVFDKVRNIVLEKLVVINEELYTKVEEGKVQYKGYPMGVDPFVIRNFAITNLEYKLFLSDLLRQGRTSDLQVAMVQSDGWKGYGCNELAEKYFMDERYNDFPVVNVSREGALLFCAWFQQQANEYYKVKKGRQRKLVVRLPYDYEWLYAAKTGYAQIPDCGGYNTIYDVKEGLVDKAFLRRMSNIKKRDRESATYMDELYAINRFGMDEKGILQIFEKGIRYNGETSGDSLYPGGMSALSKAGHVSEIIQDRDGKMVVMGSCWKSKEEYLGMLSEFKKASGSPFVGFRIVIANSERASYKDPFW